MSKSARNWIPARPGISGGYAAASLRARTAGTPGGAMAYLGVRAQRTEAMNPKVPGGASVPASWRPSAVRGGVHDGRLRNQCDLRFEQRIQDEQGRSVGEHLFGGMSNPASATAHNGASLTKGGMSGPYPWRRPV